MTNYPNDEMAKDAKWELDHLGQDINSIDELVKPESESQETPVSPEE